MPPESVKTARIRGSKARNESGSVSPSALSDSGRGKMIFAEKMRNMYGNQDPKELEIKIEQLWNGLTPLQREKFIGVSGEKENVKVKSEVPNAKPVVPILERRNNCKAIAKVLDLKVTKPMTPYADLVKNRISSVWKEGSVDNFRQAKISPLSLLTCSTTVQTPPPSPPNDTEFDDMPMTKSEVVKPKDTPKKATFKMPSLNLSAPPKKGTFKTVTRKFVVKKVQKPIGPRISYEKACQEYYKALSQSFLVDNYATDTTMLPIYADIIEGCQPIREYTFGGLL